MSKKRVMYQLLITATNKNDSNVKTFGYGLNYPIPIVRPTWVGMDKIIAAQASGKLDIMVHNVEPPVLLTKKLYNKFVDLGYIDKEVVENTPGATDGYEDSKELKPSHGAGGEAGDDSHTEIPQEDTPSGPTAERIVVKAKTVEPGTRKVQTKLYERNAEKRYVTGETTVLPFAVEATMLDPGTKAEDISVEVYDASLPTGAKIENVESLVKGGIPPIYKVDGEDAFSSIYKFTVPAGATYFSVKLLIAGVVRGSADIGIDK